MEDNKEDKNAVPKGTNPRRDNTNNEGQTSRNDANSASGDLPVSNNRAANNSSSSSSSSSSSLSTYHLADRWQNSSNDFLDEVRAFGASDPAPAPATAVPHNLPGAPPNNISHGLPVRASARQRSRRAQGVTPRASAARSRARNQRTSRNPPASRAVPPTVSLAPPSLPILPPPPPMAPPNSYRNATTQTNAATQDASAQTEDSTTANNDALESSFSALLTEGPLLGDLFAGIEQPSGTPAADLPRRAVSPAFGPQYYANLPSNVGEALPPGRAYVGDLPTLFPPQQYQYPYQPLPGVAVGGFWSSYQPITNPYHPDYVAPPPPQQQQQFPTLQQMVANPNPPPLPRQRRGAGTRQGAEMRYDPLRRAAPSSRRADRSFQQQQQAPTTPGGRSTYPLPSPATPAPTFNPIFETPQEPKPKRARRRGDEIDKIFFCDHEGCGKAYGQLHHLNEHIRKSGHGKEKDKAAFKEAKEALNLREKARREARREEERKKKGGKDGGDGDDDDDENDEDEWET
ncbi:MAG: hypothetical protein M1836_002774 [Candelina mexicana]|nr:MAG: hypothetical protein M1836_002774 [Candelina mexicana]